MSAIAQTRCGKVEGEEKNGLFVFRGIPYAAPPVGARRWRAPEKPEAWSGVRRAVEFGAAAPQNRVPLEALAAFVVSEPQSEDCLFLNVWTPGLDGARRPVMVWIHGGAFTIGSGAQTLYEGSALAKRGDVVVVTINYRLGPLGFLRLDELTQGRIPSTGNEGIQDQVRALEWVRENVAAFGGDPDNVTIFGESAGGMSVGTLLGLPGARGLFHKAIPQSGACNTANTREQAVRVAEKVGELSGLRDADALLALTPEKLLQISAQLSPGPGVVVDRTIPGMPMQPVLDGTVQPRRAIDSVAAGSAAGVAVLVGATSEEWKLFGALDPTIASLPDEQLAARFEPRLGAATKPILDAYRKARSGRGAPATAAEIYNAIETDRIFRLPGIVLAETQAKHDRRVYQYLYTQPAALFGGMLGACHAVELGFVFGTHQLPGVSDFTGKGPAIDALAEKTMDAWLAFARTGDPSTKSLGTWPTYTAADRATMVLGEKSGLERAPLAAQRAAWAHAPASVLGQP
jgi:para-nitrobenzyl esterase